MAVKERLPLVASQPAATEAYVAACPKSIASFPVSTPQVFFAHSKISGKKSWGVETGNEGIPNRHTHTHSHPSIDPAPAVFGVVRKVQEGPIGRDSTHTDQQMYSCGSLAPKMKRRGSGDGTEVNAFHKPAEPWEKSEG